MNDLIEKLSNLRSQFNCFDENENEAYHTLSEAIKVISERPESCEDTVSRQAAIDALLEEVRLVDGYYVENDEVIDKDDAIEAIRLLPSVTPKLDHSGDTTEMVEYDDCISRQAVADVAYEVGNLFDGEDDTRTPYGVAFDIQMAVDKLPSVTPKSEPCEDAVSRKAVIDLYKRGAEIIAKAKGISVEDMPHNGLDALMNLPSVTPKRKTGKWIEDMKRFGDDAYHCDQCGAILEEDALNWKNNYFCYHCGAKMNGRK